MLNGVANPRNWGICYLVPTVFPNMSFDVFGGNMDEGENIAYEKFSIQHNNRKGGKVTVA